MCQGPTVWVGLGLGCLSGLAGKVPAMLKSQAQTLGHLIPAWLIY